jgi:enoyl-CoA hydratase/carnithine racemase
MPLAKAFEYAQLMLPNMARTQDAKEGFSAFREKRSPIFQGN